MEENPKLKENCTGGLGMAELLQEAVKEAQESVVTTDKGTEILDRLACITGSEVIVILTVNDRVISYATPALQPLLSDESGRALIVKCLYSKLQNQFLSQVTQPFEDDKTPVFGKQRQMDDYAYIEDTEKCVAALKTKFMELREKFLEVTKPANPNGEEGLLVVATFTHQLLTIASPMLKNMIETPQGMRIFQTLLQGK